VDGDITWMSTSDFTSLDCTFYDVNTGYGIVLMDFNTEQDVINLMEINIYDSSDGSDIRVYPITKCFDSDENTFCQSGTVEKS